MYQCQDNALVYKKTGRQEGLNCFPSTLESGINVGVRLSIFEKKIRKKHWKMTAMDWCKNELKFWYENL